VNYFVCPPCWFVIKWIILIGYLSFFNLMEFIAIYFTPCVSPSNVVLYPFPVPVFAFFAKVAAVCQFWGSALCHLPGNPSCSCVRAQCFTPGVRIVTTPSAKVLGMLLRGTCPFLNVQFGNLHHLNMCTQHTKGCPLFTYSGIVGRSVMCLLAALRILLSWTLSPRAEM
jgi:hypothetical protein